MMSQFSFAAYWQPDFCQVGRVTCCLGMHWLPCLCCSVPSAGHPFHSPSRHLALRSPHKSDKSVTLFFDFARRVYGSSSAMQSERRGRRVSALYSMPPLLPAGPAPRQAGLAVVHPSRLDFVLCCWASYRGGWRPKVRSAPLRSLSNSAACCNAH